jgi:hypothetical protein
MINKPTGWLLALATLGILMACVGTPQSTQAPKTFESSTLKSIESTATLFKCPVTPYSRQKPPDSHTASFTESWYGNDALWAGLAPAYQGDWYAGPKGVKVLWYRSVSGQLTVEGRRLDAEAPQLQADIPAGYGNSGYQASGLIFASAGCWEVIGRVADEALRFVVEVHPATEDPTNQRNLLHTEIS